MRGLRRRECKERWSLMRELRRSVKRVVFDEGVKK